MAPFGGLRIPSGGVSYGQTAAVTHEITIHCPDGQVKRIPLTGVRLSVGRSSAAEISFPEDAGLSRQHFQLEAENGGWTVEDLGSKNGTFVNGNAVKTRVRLEPGDRISAGRLTIVFDPAAGAAPVVVFEGEETEGPGSATFVTSLEGALASQTRVRTAGAPGAAQVQALIKAGRELAGNRPLAQLFPVILDLALEAVGARRGVVMTMDDGELTAQANKGEGFRISTAVRDRVLNLKASVLVRDTELDDAFRGRHSIVEQKVHTLMAVPLQTGDRIIGLIYVDSPSMVREFSREDLSLLTVMANVAAIRIEHARLAEIEQADRLLQRELEQAAEIQRSLLPASPPAAEGVDLAGYNAPCRTVGGDYYDFLRAGDGRMLLLLGDVSGKGMPASLLMVGMHARVHALAENLSDTGVLMSRLNAATCESCPSNRFVTLFCAALDPATGELAWANAGHNPPFVVRAAGEVAVLEGGGPPLGIRRDARYEEYRGRLGPGEMLVVYSDGVTEATNAAEEEFGEARLGEVLCANRARPAVQVVEAVRQAVADFTAGAPVADDLTIVVARR